MKMIFIYFNSCYVIQVTPVRGIHIQSFLAAVFIALRAGTARCAESSGTAAPAQVDRVSAETTRSKLEDTSETGELDETEVVVTGTRSPESGVRATCNCSYVNRNT